MPAIAITGVGVSCGRLSTHDVLDRISSGARAQSAKDIQKPEVHVREVLGKLAREDRSILTAPSARCLRTAMDAFEMAESIAPIDGDRRENIAVYTSAERDREFPAELWQMVHGSGRETRPNVEGLLAEIGSLRQVVHPLALFKKLPTNTLYHISKYFGLRGGGYPFQRMSLGGLCMLEEASAKIARGSLQGALLSAYGNMDNLDNRLAFTKMGLIRNQDNGNGIEPSAGAASALIEPLDQVEARGACPLAIVHRIRSSFRDQMYARSEDWLDFYRRTFADLEGTSPVVIRYDNGIAESGDAEQAAIAQFLMNQRASPTRSSPATPDSQTISSILSSPCLTRPCRPVSRSFSTGSGLRPDWPRCCLKNA